MKAPDNHKVELLLRFDHFEITISPQAVVSSVRMQKSNSKGAWNSEGEDFEDKSTETRQVEMDKFQERKKRSQDVPEEEDELLISIDKLMEEVELSLTEKLSSSDSEDTNWETIWEALKDHIELETEVKFVAEDYERVQQDILACRNDMEKLLQELKEAKQQQGDDVSEAEDAKSDEVDTSLLQDRDDHNTGHPDQNASKDKELRGSFKCKRPFAAEPHVETTKAKLLSGEALQTFCPGERSKLPLEAELQQEKMKNKAVQEELEKVKVSCADEIQKYKVQLHNVQQQLESLQHVHQKHIQKALKEQSELSKQEVKKAKAAFESELQTCKDKLKDVENQNELLQRDLRKAQETSGKGQSGVQLPLELQACKKDLKTVKQQMDSFRKNPRWDLQSTESSLFMTGLGSMGMLSNKGMSQSLKTSEKKVRSRVIQSLQSELERTKKEVRQEKELCERLQREKESIQMSYKEQQNELSYTKRHVDSMNTQLEDYKKRYVSKAEENDHLKKDLKKVRKSFKKKQEKRTKSNMADAEDKVQPDPSQSNKKKRGVKDDRAQEGSACVEPPAERTTRKNPKPSADAERKASAYADPQTSPESQKSSKSPQKSTFKMVCDFLGLRKTKK